MAIQPQNNKLSYSIDPVFTKFTKVNRLLVLSFERNAEEEILFCIIITLGKASK